MLGCAGLAAWVSLVLCTGILFLGAGLKIHADFLSDSTEAPFYGAGSFTMPQNQQAFAQPQDTDFCRVECSSRDGSFSEQNASWFRQARAGVAAGLECQAGEEAVCTGKSLLKR